MTSTLDRSTIKVEIALQILNALDLGTVKAPSGLRKTYSFTNGTGAAQAKTAFADERTTDDTGEDLDLAGGLTNAAGETITFTAIKGMAIKADDDNTLDVLVGGAASAQFDTWVGDASDVVAVKPGGLLLLVDPGATGYAVTATTADLLHIAASASGNVTYKIVLLGEV